MSISPVGSPKIQTFEATPIQKKKTQGNTDKDSETQKIQEAMANVMSVAIVTIASSAMKRDSDRFESALKKPSPVAKENKEQQRKEDAEKERRIS